MPRTSFYSVYVLFKSPEDRAKWEARLPKPAEGETGKLQGCEMLPSVALDDGNGGFWEGEFLKVLARREDVVADLIRIDPARCYEPRRDGFVWPELAPICTADPTAFAREHVKNRRMYGDDQGELEDIDG
jgi:hypothetical protein